MSQEPDASGRYLEHGFWKHGRWFGNWRPNKYVFPIDSEELNRLDIFHKFFLVARDDATYKHRITRTDRRPRIMDLGTGTGIWAVQVADAQPGCDMVAVDLNRIQPPLIPPNMRTIQFDVEDSSWEPLYRDCDLIFMRLMFGSIQSNLWPDVYRRAFEHLSPGDGRFEQVEVDWTPGWDGTDRPEPSALQEWYESFSLGMDRFNKTIKVSPDDTRRQLEYAGFIDVEHETIKCYTCPWSLNDDEQNNLARWFNLGIDHGLEAMSVLPLVESLGMEFSRMRELVERAKRETCVLRFHTYMTLHIWTARRPPST